MFYSYSGSFSHFHSLLPLVTVTQELEALPNTKDFSPSHKQHKLHLQAQSVCRAFAGAQTPNLLQISGCEGAHPWSLVQMWVYYQSGAQA